MVEVEWMVKVCVLLSLLQPAADSEAPVGEVKYKVEVRYSVEVECTVVVTTV